MPRFLNHGKNGGITSFCGQSRFVGIGFVASLCNRALHGALSLTPRFSLQSFLLAEVMLCNYLILLPSPLQFHFLAGRDIDLLAIEGLDPQSDSHLHAKDIR